MISPRDILQRLLTEMNHRLGKDEGDDDKKKKDENQDVETLQQLLLAALEEAVSSRHKRVVIVLDGLDRSLKSGKTSKDVLKKSGKELSELSIFGYFRLLDKKIDSLISCADVKELLQKVFTRLEEDYNIKERPDNLVQEQCPKLQELRTAVWPEETSLHTKLYGSWQELQKMAHFIVTTSLPVAPL
nr:hypothetical protein BaRGS_026311 [Batillaria attramentaria]